MLIVVGSDDRYALPLAITAHSALRRLAPGAEVTLLVVDGGITKESRRRIERVVQRARFETELRWVRPEVRHLSGLRATDWGSPAQYLPLLIPRLVDDSQFALYLDSDLLVLGDLAEMWRRLEEGSGVPVHAVLDYGLHHLGEALNRDVCERLGMDPEAPYFNSGVVVIDLQAWRMRGIPEAASAFARDHADVVRFADQDALNATIQGDWSRLDDRWNVLVGSIDLLLERWEGSPQDKARRRVELVQDAHIYHFSGPRKPWKPGARRIGRRAYLAEIRMSGWFETPGEYRRWRWRLAALSPLVRTRRLLIPILGPSIVAVRKLLRRIERQGT